MAKLNFNMPNKVHKYFDYIKILTTYYASLYSLWVLVPIWLPTPDEAAPLFFNY